MKISAFDFRVFSLVFCLMIGQSNAAGHPSSETKSLILNMQLVGFERLKERGLNIVSVMKIGSEVGELMIRIPPGHWEKDDRSPSGVNWYRFPVFFEATGHNRKLLDSLVSDKFGKGSPATLFKPKGYSGSSYRTAKELSDEGGEVAIADPGVEGTREWSINIEINPLKESLILRLNEQSF